MVFKFLGSPQRLFSFQVVHLLHTGASAKLPTMMLGEFSSRNLSQKCVLSSESLFSYLWLSFTFHFLSFLTSITNWKWFTWNLKQLMLCIGWTRPTHISPWSTMITWSCKGLWFFTPFEIIWFFIHAQMCTRSFHSTCARVECCWSSPIVDSQRLKFSYCGLLHESTNLNGLSYDLGWDGVLAICLVFLRCSNTVLQKSCIIFPSESLIKVLQV